MTEAEALKIATHRHYKAGLYRYIGKAIHSEDLSEMVVYEHVYPHEQKMWVRPAELFFGNLEDGSPRFAALSKEAITSVTDDSFHADVLAAPGITVIDFWAPWCGPCKMLMPSLEKVAEQFAGKVKVVKMNVDENQTIPTQYGVRGIPNMMAFVGGKQVLNAVGAKSLGQVQAMFEKLVVEHGTQ